MIISTRWRKLLSDAQFYRGRMVMMVVAIAVSIFAIGSIMSAYTILTREISTNYLGTKPASAFLKMDNVTDALVDAVRTRPGIDDAEASSVVMARIEIKPDEWMPLMLFVVRDFKAMHISTFQPEAGDWSPPEGSILLEREALPLVNAKVGDMLSVQTPNGVKSQVAIAGLVHDPSLTPAWQEQTAYGYVTPATLVRLGESDQLHILKILVKDQPYNAAVIEHAVSELDGWLKQQGHVVDEIRIPPPGKHPHQSQMTAVMVMLLSFSLMALVLSAILTATMINGLLAQQVRQIGIMKAVGAQTWQIARVYLVLILLIGIAAVCFGLLPGTAAGIAFARVVAQLLNITLYSEAIPGWVYLVQILAGILVPFVIALVPIFKTTRTTVREAINDYGIRREKLGSRRIDVLLGKIRGFDRTMIMALRNSFRRRGRLVLTLSLLAVAGGVFMASLNVKTAWQEYLTAATSQRHYDLEIRLNRPEQEGKIVALLAHVTGVQQVESWNMASAARNRPDGLNIVKTYPDEGHGSFTIRSAPPESKMLQLPLISGRWLERGDTDAVVLNHMAQGFFPNVKVGDIISLNVNGRLATFRLAGIAQEILTPATAYVSPKGFVEASGQLGQSSSLRVILQGRDNSTQKAVIKEIERTLEKENISTKIVISASALDRAHDGHVFLFIFSLLVMSVVVAIVGILGLMSAMGTSVVERTREFGVMRTIGGRAGTILRNIISEGIFIGIMSCFFAIILSLPLTAFIGKLLGNLSFGAPLPLVISPIVVAVWMIIIVLGSVAASAYPAWRASKLTIREALAYL